MTTEERIASLELRVLILTDERIKHLERRVTLIENLLKLTVIDYWIEREKSKLALLEPYFDNMSDDAKSDIETSKKILKLASEWFESVRPFDKE